MKLVLLIAMLVCSLFANQLGGWEQLTNVQNDTYAKVALQLVKNKLENSDCQFDKLEKAYTQKMAGTNYKFEIWLICQNEIHEEYEVTVFSQPWTGTLKITSMRQLFGHQQQENK